MAFDFKYQLPTGEAVTVEVNTDREGHPEVSVVVPIVYMDPHRMPAIVYAEAASIWLIAEGRWKDERDETRHERVAEGVRGSEPA